MEAKIAEILAEHRRRVERRRARGAYDPLKGRRMALRTGNRVATPEPDVPLAYLPKSMVADADYEKARTDATLWRLLRCRHDFEYWCVRCVKIKHKTRDEDTPLVLNAAQRDVVDALERQRAAGRPLRLIVLKARQWGASTLIQAYMAWMQICVHRNWNSLICAHVKDAASAIRGAYTKLLENYPKAYWEGDEEPEFRPYERAQNIRMIKGRDCRVTIGSSETQDSFRGADYAMAHLSETAFWSATPQRSPEQCVRAVCGAVAYIPDSLIIMESTANGVGNYFHREWLRCKEGRGDKEAVFVPWYRIEMYALRPDDPAALAGSLTEYERRLWDLGLDLEQIYWFRMKLREYPSMESFQAEYPTSDIEAFASTGDGIFSAATVEEVRRNCREAAEMGEAHAPGVFAPDACGRLKVWERPEVGASYVAAVDVGGRSDKADWSVVLVMRQGEDGAPHRVVAQWRGHCDHDVLVRHAEDIGRYYRNALLIIESNTLETEAYGGVEAGGDGNLFVLNRLAERYPNLYRRENFDTVTRQRTSRVGFHTNTATKGMLIAGLVEAVRTGAFIERDNDACDELLTYERRRNGSYGARPGCHDDMLMTRAMALHALHGLPPRSAVAAHAANTGWQRRQW